jgi:hypothetical protein
MEWERVFGDFSRIQQLAVAESLATTKYFRENEAKIAAQVRPLVDFCHKYEAQFAQFRTQLEPLRRFLESEQCQATLRNSLSYLKRTDFDLAAKIKSLDDCKLGSENLFPTRAPEPPLKPKRKIGFDS